MTRPYFLYNGFRYLIDTPLLILSFWLADYYSNGAIDSEQDSIVFIFLLISIISWYSAAQVSGLTKDLRSNKFAEEIIYVLVTLILFAIILPLVKKQTGDGSIGYYITGAIAAVGVFLFGALFR